MAPYPKLYWAVDRVENGIAVLISDDGKQYQVRSNTLREGQIWYMHGGRWRRDRAEEKRRLKAARELYQALPRGPAGNITL